MVRAKLDLVLTIAPARRLRGVARRRGAEKAGQLDGRLRAACSQEHVLRVELAVDRAVRVAVGDRIGHLDKKSQRRVERRPGLVFRKEVVKQFLRRGARREA